MLLTFFALKPIVINHEGRPWSPPVVEDESEIRITDMFLCGPAYVSRVRKSFGDDAVRVIDVSEFAAARQIPICLNKGPSEGRTGRSLFPVDRKLMEDVKQRMSSHGRKTPRIALLSGLGGALGDSLVGAHAVQFAYALLTSLFGNVTIDILASPNGKARRIWQHVPTIKSVRTYPFPYSDFCEYDAYFDFTRFDQLYGNGKIPWPDFQYEALGIDSQLVPKELKSISWLPAEEDTAEWVNLHLQRVTPRKRVYVHNSTSSRFKEAPPEYLAKILAAIVSAGYHIVTEDTGVYELACSLGIDCALVTCASPSESIELIRCSNWAVCTDTYALHLAACSKTPTIGIFTIWPSTLIAPYQLNISAVDIDPVGDFRGAMERKGWSLEDPDTKARLYEKWSESWPKLEEKIKSFIASIPASKEV